MNFKTAVCRYLTVAVFLSCVCSAYPASKNEQKEQASQPASGGMSFERSWLMYNDAKKSPLGPFLINFFLVNGLGNYLVDGYLTGTLILVGQVYFMVIFQNTTATDAEKSMAAQGLLVVAILGMITPFTDTAAYNKKLKKKYGLITSVKPTNDLNGIQLALEKRF